MEAVRAAYQAFTGGNLDRFVESLAADVVSRQSAAVPAGLLIGVPLFGIVAAIILIMFFASAVSTAARSRGGSPRLGLVIGFLVLAIVTLVINVAVR
jgi:tetrahydromethanopterin S-methyltransferase subunit G